MSEPARARLSVHFFLDRLRDQTDLLRNQQFPGSQIGPHLWLDLAVGLLDTAESYLQDAESANAPDALKLTKAAAELCSVCYDHLSNLTGATSDHIPWSVVDPLSRWFAELGVSNDIFFRAELRRNYEIKRFEEREFRRYRSPSVSLTNALAKIKWPLLRVTVPSAALSILPHFAIVAHEVGHKVPVSYTTTDLQPIINEVVNRITTQLGGFDLQTSRDFQNIIYRWIAEFHSDAVAFYLTGPASFFSIDFTQLASMGHHGIGPTHPAHLARCNIMFRQLINGAPTFADIFEKHTGVALTEDLGSSLLPTVPNDTSLHSEILLRTKSSRVASVIVELNKSAEAIAQIIYRDVQGHLLRIAPGSQYTVTRYDDDLKHHLEAITFTIPPIEEGDDLANLRPCTFASIINIGWAAVLTKVDRIRVRPDPDHPKTGALSTIHNLLLKALELSEAKRRWEAA